MTCSDCSSEHQHGRFCIRCGRKRPPLPRGAVSGRVRAAPVRDGASIRLVGGRTTPTERSDENVVREMYDSALARAGCPGERSLDRYLSVLLRTPRSA